MKFGGPLSVSHPSHPQHKLMCEKCALPPLSVSHPSHPQHKLMREHTTKPFKCDGCKEAGIGNKYKCDECDFHLHEKCALPPPTIEHSSFYKNCKFGFHHKLPRKLKCDACNKVVRGFGYRCRNGNCDYVLHPCCANLPWVLHDGKLELRLNWKSLPQPCNKCKKKGPGWSYSSDCQNLNLHVACAKELLMEAWYDMHKNKDEKKVKKMQATIPEMAVTPKNHHHVKGKGGGGGWGKTLKYVRFFAVAALAVVSGLLGDPTAIIAALATYILPSQRNKRLGN